ncbi:MAG: O-antigen ligase family protein [Anaerolineae bacterium]|nr:O-antigen ligase family protein [Anaerolineae bacterium]
MNGGISLTTKDTKGPLSPSCLLWALCSVFLLLTLLAGGAVVANHRADTRGIPQSLPEPVADADVPLSCINVALHATTLPLEQALRLVADGGFVWVRQPFPWAQIEPTPGQYDWALWDRITEATSARNLRLIAVLERPPQWAGSPPDPADFARFAGAVAARYGDRIDFYQVWHNPNLKDGWGTTPHPAQYAELLRQAALAIRAADSGARILLGSLAPTVERGPENLSEVRFLEELYIAGAAPYFDIITAQAYGFETGPEDRRVSEDVLNFSRAVLIREVMEARGEGKKALWVSHFGWNNLPPEWKDVPSIWGTVDEATQAEYTARALERARREWPWVGAMCLSHLQPDLSLPEPGVGTPDARRHWGFALVGPDGTPRPVYWAVADWARRSPINDPGYWTPASGVAAWEGGWEFSELGADPGQEGTYTVTVPFWGTDFGLRVRRGNYRAYLYVTIDGEPANALPRDEAGRAYVILTSPDYQPQEITIPVARGLPAGPHTAVVVAERGWDQWPLAGWSVGYRPEEHAHRRVLLSLGVLALGALAGMAVVGRRMDWGRVGHTITAAWARFSERVRWAVTLAVTGLLWAGAWMTWGLETGGGVFRRLGEGGGLTAVLAAAALFYYSPWFLLTIFAGLALFGIVLLRPDYGLALIAGLAPFYTLPRPLLDKAFSMAEILTLMTAVAWGVRVLTPPPAPSPEVWPFSGRGQGNIQKSPPMGHKEMVFRGGEAVATKNHQNYLLYVLGQKGWGWVRSPVFALLLVALISTLFADFQRVAWRELRTTILEPVLFYLMLRTLPMGRREIWRVADFFVLGGVAVALIGLVQYALGVNLITAEGGLPRLRSIYGSPNNVGLYLGRVLPILVAVALLARDRGRRLAYGLAALPVAAALLLSFSKGALLLGIPAALVAVGLLAGGRWRWATLALLLVLALAILPLMSLPRFASLFSTQEGTTFFRLKLWQGTVAMIRDHFWLGVGPDNFLYHYRSRYILPSAWQEPDLSHPHNFLLDFWARLGIFGAVAGIWLLVAFWRAALPLRHHPDPDARALAIGLIGGAADMLAHGLVDHSFFLIDLAFAFLMALALVERISERRRTLTDADRNKDVPDTSPEAPGTLSVISGRV